MREYKLGDKWSADFDYDGMLETATKINVDSPISDLKKLSESLTDVNYHTLNKNLTKAIELLDKGKKNLAEAYIQQFHKDVILYKTEQYEEDVQLILSLAYPNIYEMCLRNGLILDEAYYISDGSSEKYHPSIMTLKDDKDNVLEVILGYYDYDENTLAHINIDVIDKEANIESDFWEVEDSEKLILGYGKGGSVKDRGIRPSPKESATIYKDGTRKKAQDGDMWEVTTAKNGVKRWKKVSKSSERVSRERKVVTKAKHWSFEIRRRDTYISDFDKEYQLLLYVLEDEVPDSTKISIIEDSIGKFLMYDHSPILDYTGYLNTIDEYVPFNIVSFTKEDDELNITFATINKQLDFIFSKKMKFNAYDYESIMHGFVVNIGNGSFKISDYKSSGSEFSLPQALAKLIYNRADYSLKYFFISDVFAKWSGIKYFNDLYDTIYITLKDDITKADVSSTPFKNWQKQFASAGGVYSESDYENFVRNLKVGDLFILLKEDERIFWNEEGEVLELVIIDYENNIVKVKPTWEEEIINSEIIIIKDLYKLVKDGVLEYQPLSGSYKEKTEEKEIIPQKTGVNDWIFDIEQDAIVYDYNNIVWSISTNKSKSIIIFVSPQINKLVFATPKPDDNKTQIIYDNIQKGTKVTIKTINQGTFSSFNEYINLIRPVLFTISKFKYDDGGEINDGNYYMLQNQAVQFKHHAEELKEALEDKPKIDAWVVAKAERAATDLSDITHYLEGKNEAKFEEGGDILDQDTVSRIDSIDLADASAYEDGGEIRDKQQIQQLYNKKVDAVKKLKPIEVVDSWNRNSWSVANGYSKPIGYGEYKPELRMYLANLLFEMELTPEEYSAYMKKGGYVRKSPAKFKDKVSAISKRLEGTQVSPKYRSEYGKFYNREESIEAARKIAGKMIQKEKNK